MLQWNRNVTGLARFVGNSILFRILTGMDSWGMLNFFTNFRLPHSKNTGNIIIMIYGKSKFTFRLDWNHITKLHFKCLLKQKRSLTYTSSWPNLESNQILCNQITSVMKFSERTFNIQLVKCTWSCNSNFTVLVKNHCVIKTTCKHESLFKNCK